MAKKERNLEKVKIILLIVIAIILLLNLFQKSGMLENIQKVSRKLLNNEEMIISEDGTVAQTLDSSNWDTSKVTKVTDNEGKVVPVPKGYVASQVTGENKVSEGFVIYEGTEIVNDSNAWNSQISRNQWVWIPVKDPDRIYEEVNGVKKAKLYEYTYSGRAIYENRNLEPAILPNWDNATNLSNGGLLGMTKDKLYQELQQEFDSTIESIEKYGGFYIGRYETGNLSQSKPVVRKMNTDIADQTWYTMYSKAGYLGGNENVKTNMIWGCLYDEILQYFLEEMFVWTSEILNVSYRWGNFVNSTFTYTTTNGGSATKNLNNSIRIPTGSTNYTRKYNIYDLAGNVYSATLEGNNSVGRIYRGSSYINNTEEWPMSIRGFWNPSTKESAYHYRTDIEHIFI